VAEDDSMVFSTTNLVDGEPDETQEENNGKKYDADYGACSGDG
jgi:hypothetical protein